jgi:hypothetical protein
VAHAFERRRADDLGKEGFGSLVAVQNGALAALLIVEHELQGEARAARPLRLGRLPPIADQVTRIGV